MQNQYLAGFLFCGLLAMPSAEAGQPKPVDANKDGTVTFEEIANKWGNSKEERIDTFKRFDANHDGFLTKEEVGYQQVIDKLDGNHDGKVSQNEFLISAAVATQKAAVKADKNGDGKLTPDERVEAWKEHRAKQKAKGE